MDKLPSFLTGLLFAVLGVTILYCFQDYGLVWDSEVQKNYGNLVLLYYLTGFTNKTALNYFDLQYYGGGFESLLQVVSNLVLFSADGFLFETRHLLTAFAGLGGVYCAYRIGCILGNRWTGFLAALFLALTPRFFGHMFNNSKDAPMAVFYLFTLYGIMRFFQALPRPDWRVNVLLGVVMGFTMSIRVGAGILFLYLLAAVALYLLLDREARNFKGVRKCFLALLAVGSVAWIVMLLFWPWAQSSPIARPIEAALLFSRFTMDSPQLFNGVLVSSRELPMEYIPRWWLVSTPEFYFVLALAPLLLFFRGGRQERERPWREGAGPPVLILILSIALPAGIAVFNGMVLNDGIRHFLFLTPPLAVLAALTFTEIQKRLTGAFSAGRYILAGLVALALLLGLRDMVALHPYQAVYFNRSFGEGVERASAQFDFDFWGNSQKAGAEWLRDHHRPEPGRQYIVSNCSQPSQIEYWLDKAYYVQKDKTLFRFYLGYGETRTQAEVLNLLNNPPGPYRVVLHNDNEAPDLWLATKRFNCHEKYPGRRLHTVRREGADLLYVIEVEG